MSLSRSKQRIGAVTNTEFALGTDPINLLPITASEEHRPQLIESSWEQLDRQDRHLWILAIVLLSVLGASLLIFMIPSVFWFNRETAVADPERAFFGFGVLLALVLAYLLERQATVRRLRQKLYEARTAVAVAEKKAVCQGFLALPCTDQFRDELAMEYRRASTLGAPLATMLFGVPKASTEVMGRLASVLGHMLRQGENLYRISGTAVGIIFPGMHVKEVASFAAQAAKLSGIPNEGCEITTAVYPEEAASLSELEERLSTESIRIHKYTIGERPSPRQTATV